MSPVQERILLVENDPEISDLIARQTLQPMGYRVAVVGGANQAIQEAVRFAPDVIIANLHLPGLSGKDLLVALSSQGVEVPVIVIANKGAEAEVIQAFRLGASDYLSWPVREAEVVSAVERATKQVRARADREALARQLNQTNQELQRRVRELSMIYSIGKAVTSVTDLRTLLDKIIEGAMYVTEGDCCWMLVKDERGKAFILSAGRNLPEAILGKIGQPWDDGISSLVGLSGETLSIHGEPLKRFKVARLGQSALVVPIKVKNEVAGLLVVMRKASLPFNPSNQALLEAVADYASVSLVNARLFVALEERAKMLQHAAESAQSSERAKDEALRILAQKTSSVVNDLNESIAQIELTQREAAAKLSPDQAEVLKKALEHLQSVRDLIETIVPRASLAVTAPLGAPRRQIPRFWDASKKR